MGPDAASAASGPFRFLEGELSCGTVFFPSLLSLSLALGLCVLPAAALETDDLKTLLQTYYVDQVPENVLDQDTVQAVLDA